MDYVTTNIRISEEDYLRLKEEAAKKRKSLSAIIREKLARKGGKSLASKKKLIAQTKKLAQQNAKYLKDFDVVGTLREMRYKEAK
ncbi:MAG: hypothetical protein A3D24_04160 [Candidatus Blackburnbacteria bacterium RIFCSPHIGHO2_02_FULL_39_13]|uniref:Ribbon-helix-helix protein CopG domain-containing protein n=1 Tax=Candidatus Blackburnbacteria bacterium RIFCSPLOWO2_01_FULL_40_20 TaxID=1797519 RepID=A0A1G1VAK1_9BACT|nr:MAG: hypothetical protein UT38_C0002G0012 [Microgenomates group bacterium GW2011_GWA2_39_19]OGY07372.1 MAG: hypothetical protein A2694_01935 [Candidatus Blackburnbacteria bacterium RIFCSPHIGHO2_01_FULL_40_17]OGY09852.1 MAG: hypothetical protein A3D24_04160 [Candidatus Blackburnbacteria bacterium RIFCSPHIGHO2_02_FULL_39_13]OGY12475.1 MAG: hypothetical protein A3A77_00670 [Candidatus Blackburnbacteria bacterium RIFCSPLOWO2_01_FULL_40_20]